MQDRPSGENVLSSSSVGLMKMLLAKSDAGARSVTTRTTSGTFQFDAPCVDHKAFGFRQMGGDLGNR